MKSFLEENGFIGPIEMDLRDYFAAKAMQSLLTHQKLYLYDKAEAIGLDDWDDYVVETAYFVADKMLKAKKQ